MRLLRETVHVRAGVPPEGRAAVVSERLRVDDGTYSERSIVGEVRGVRRVRTPAETSPTIRALRSPGELLCCTWWTRLSDCRRAYGAVEPLGFGG